MDNRTATGSTEEATALLKACGANMVDGAVMVGEREWIVMFYGQRKRPPITRWMGWPVRYMMNGGRPRAY